MIRTELNLQPIIPFSRVTAAELSATASRYESMLTLECEGLVLNMKSMLGLLSQAKLPEGRGTLVADGPDELIATQAVLDAVARQRT
jgi:phosphotransferase system HPr-like phosphotransfer protein